MKPTIALSPEVDLKSLRRDDPVFTQGFFGQRAMDDLGLPHIVKIWIK